MGVGCEARTAKYTINDDVGAWRGKPMRSQVHSCVSESYACMRMFRSCCMCHACLQSPPRESTMTGAFSLLIRMRNANASSPHVDTNLRPDL
jgi:hypothetical protein